MTYKYLTDVSDSFLSQNILFNQIVHIDIEQEQCMNSRLFIDGLKKNFKDIINLKISYTYYCILSYIL